MKYIPNILTIARIPLAIICFYYILANKFLIAFIVFSAAMILDALDGFIARKTFNISNFGKILDPIADKVLIGLSLIGLCVVARVNIAAVIIIFAREILITGLRLYIAKKSIILPANIFGKLKTVIQTIAILHALLPYYIYFNAINFFLFFITVIITALSGVIYIYDINRRLKYGSKH